MNTINKVGIIGAGTMGAGIAAHLVNSGLEVLLLDRVTPNLSQAESNDPEARNRHVEMLFDRMLTARPVQLGHPSLARKITLGNIEDDFDKLAACDWIIEVIIETLAPKQTLMARLETVVKPDAIISSNTSGIPITEIAAGRSAEFQSRFLGTHFFNPPRYLKLLEIIPTTHTDPAVVELISDFGRNQLGKGVVLCKDTPNFIANRFGAVTGAFIAETALSNGYAVADADALLGPLIGRPKTGYFRLADLVGLDVRSSVIRNLYPAVPDDAYRELLQGKTFWPVFDHMLANNLIGNKADGGFSKKVMVDGKRQFWTFDTVTLDYKPTELTTWPSVEAAKSIRDLPTRITELLKHNDPGANLVRSVLFNMFEYAAYVAPDIAWSLADIDNAIRWGFNYETGPFQLWDALGVANIAKQMQTAGHKVAPWVEEMLALGHKNFYSEAPPPNLPQRERDQTPLPSGGAGGGLFNLLTKQIEPIKTDPKHLQIPSRDNAILSNDSATLHDIGDRVGLIEFHSKANSIDVNILNLCTEAIAHPAFDALVIGNEGRHFSVGANFGRTATVDEHQAASDRIRLGQQTMMALLHSPKPVVSALHSRALGGGAEIAMSAWRSVAAHELMIGLVEFNVGLVPGWGGNKELLRRRVNPVARQTPDAVLPILRDILAQLMQSRVSTSAHDARALGYLRPDDPIVMNPDHRLQMAKTSALDLLKKKVEPPAMGPVYAAGAPAREALYADIAALLSAEKITPFDAQLGQKLADILTGGELAAPQWVDPWHILDLARHSSLSIRFTPESTTRRAHMMKTGKPLRN